MSLARTIPKMDHVMWNPFGKRTYIKGPRETAPLSLWDTCSGFLASSSGRCDKYECGREWVISRAHAAASRWVIRPLGCHKAAGTLVTVSPPRESPILPPNHF
ncbi:hypothetical protein F2Q69_00019023 [Brassica cretica]|uniref:Uncharacterized protein n=1 Tax=Brassica cretica TaxID=69181 RepID=A0A8S9QFA6_BRACR|nr:hypothetical protein F2Q69_00019023 [Brassica cretica]